MDWRPKCEFDPDKPGTLVHDQLSDRVIEWEWQEIDDDFYDDFPEVKRVINEEG